TANGIEIAYEEHGGGDEVLVLVNGLADTKESWEAQVPAFVDRYRVIAFDNRGLGGSSAPPGPYTTAQMAEDLPGPLLQPHVLVLARPRPAPRRRLHAARGHLLGVHHGLLRAAGGGAARDR